MRQNRLSEVLEDVSPSGVDRDLFSSPNIQKVQPSHNFSGDENHNPHPFAKTLFSTNQRTALGNITNQA